MAIHCVQGKLGGGKSKKAVLAMRQKLLEKRCVATNLDIKLDKLLPASSRQTIIRLPDKPTAADFEALPHGNPDSYDEELNGLLVLDELGTWLNARTYQDKGRQAVIDWLLHSRKHGYDCLFIVQGVEMIDRQVRDNLVEYVTRCRKFDKVKIPFVGHFLNALFGGRVGYLPKGLHYSTTRLGTGPQDLVADAGFFLGRNVHAAYDTRQVFRPDYPHGVHSMLSAWHVHGRYQPDRGTFLQRLRHWWHEPRQFHVTTTKSAIVAKIMALPANERIKHINRLERAGLLPQVRRWERDAANDSQPADRDAA